ncbi:MAG: VOC family protein [Rhodobacteraceae bacterium]|nr:VOC family protein [Paracoccaceae bacterium]
MKKQKEIKFDHFAIATEDLEKTVINLERILKFPFLTGGEHKMFGTHNRLFRLGDVYLEVIAINRFATTQQKPRWFDLDNFSGKPRIATWIAKTDNILDLLPNIWDNPGEIKKLSRDNLEWDFTVPVQGKMPMDGAAPALINWGSTRHPTLSMSDNNCRLDRFVVNTPFAEDLGSIIKKILFDERIQFEFSQQISFEAHIETPSGKVILK